MSNTLMTFAKALVVQLAACLSRTSSSSGTGQDLSAYDGMCVAVLEAGAATAGTNPTLNVTLEECDTVGGTYTAVPATAYAEAAEFSQVTTTAVTQIRRFNRGDRKAFIRATWVLGGTSTPTFPFGVAFIGQKKYQ